MFIKSRRFNSLYFRFERKTYLILASKKDFSYIFFQLIISFLYIIKDHFLLIATTEFECEFGFATTTATAATCATFFCAILGFPQTHNFLNGFRTLNRHQSRHSWPQQHRIVAMQHLAQHDSGHDSIRHWAQLSRQLSKQAFKPQEKDELLTINAAINKNLEKCCIIKFL